MKHYILFYISLFVSLPILAQMSEGGLPPSFKYHNTLKSSTPDLEPLVYELEEDVEQLRWEDSIVEQNGGPLRIATSISAEIDLLRLGEWSVLPNGAKICRMALKSPEAKGLLLSYSELYIPEGGKLFIYNYSKDQVLGAYTHLTNPAGKEFSTEIVYGDELIFEYVDSESGSTPRIKISEIGYVYSNMTKAEIGFGTSADCEVNINCSEGADWQQQKRGVAKIITQVGSKWYACSGSLINNTNQDFTPYFLTAYHCFYLPNAGSPNFSTMQFYFHYELDGCNNPSKEDKDEVELQVNARAKTMVGAQLLVANPLYGGIDGALLELNSKIPSHYDLTFNGWELDSNPASRGVGIHHPSGDVKKISTYTTPLRTGTYFDKDGRGMESAFWTIRFAGTANGYGITEKGSSGSPLFNQNRRIVGSLTGGSTTCANPNVDDYYSKFYYQWDKGTDASGKQMKEYLDPLDLSPAYLDFIEQIPDITVNADSVFIKENTSIAIDILSGNDGYTTESSDISIALPTNPGDGKSFIIRGEKAGRAEITIKDEKNKEKIIIVFVYPSDNDPITYRLNGDILTVGLMSNSEDYISAVSIVDLWGRVLFSEDRNNESLFYQINTSSIGKGVFIVKVKTKKGYVKAQKIKW